MDDQEQLEQPSYVDYQPKSGKIDKKELEELKRFRMEMRQKYPGVIFENSVETLRQVREERMKQLEECSKPTKAPTNAAPTQTTQSQLTKQHSPTLPQQPHPSQSSPTDDTEARPDPHTTPSQY